MRKNALIAALMLVVAAESVMLFENHRSKNKLDNDVICSPVITDRFRK